MPNHAPSTLTDAPGRLGNLAGELGAALAIWAQRDAAHGAVAVLASHAAVDVIDQMLGQLHAARSVLIGQIRADEDARAARIDAMLAGRSEVNQRLTSGQPQVDPASNGTGHRS